MIVAKKDTKRSKSIKLMAAAEQPAKCSFAALLLLLQLPIASVVVQSQPK